MSTRALPCLLLTTVAAAGGCHPLPATRVASATSATAGTSAVPGAPARGRFAPPGDLAARALPVAASAPSVMLPSTGGGTFSLKDALARGPAVLVFYRGDW